MNATRREPRILFLSQAYPPVFGGGGAFLANLRKSIGEQGFESEVICGNWRPSDGAQAGVHRLPTPGGERLTRLRDYTFALLTPPALIALRRRFDIIHTMGNAHYVYAAILTARLLGKKVVIASIQNRADDPGGILKQRFGRLKNALFSRADRFICLNSLQVSVYRGAGYPAEKIALIRNGIDPARFFPCASREEKSALRRALGLPAEAFVVVSVGAMIERKGMDLLVEAWRRFRARSSEAVLALVGPQSSADAGSGVEDAFVRKLKAALESEGIAGSVLFTGKVSNVSDYLRAADVFALMSRGEGFPLALLEAMSSGLPFLIWDLPDYAGYDLEDQVQGYLLPPFDTGALAQRLATLSEPGALREKMGQEARRLAARYNVQRYTAEHVQMYRELFTP